MLSAKKVIPLLMCSRTLFWAVRLVGNVLTLWYITNKLKFLYD